MTDFLEVALTTLPLTLAADAGVLALGLVDAVDVNKSARLVGDTSVCAALLLVDALTLEDDMTLAFAGGALALTFSSTVGDPSTSTTSSTSSGVGVSSTSTTLSTSSGNNNFSTLRLTSRTHHNSLADRELQFRGNHCFDTIYE